MTMSLDPVSRRRAMLNSHDIGSGTDTLSTLMLPAGVPARRLCPRRHVTRIANA